MPKTIILNQEDISNRIRRIAYQIYEVNASIDEIVIAGIEKRGFELAVRIAEILKSISDIKVELCSVKVNKKQALEPVISSMESSAYRDKSVILVDDVLNSGTTMMYGVRHFLNVPLKQLKTVVLVDRNHKKYPIKVDFKGISLSTSIQDLVKVVFSKNGDYAYLE